MSTTIDQKVVEMRFDNKNFESNVSTTMSSLDKLKQKLNLSGASKGLEQVNSAAKNVNMSGLGTAVETVSAKFSALEVMGVTALANITNSAVNAGKRIVSALTIDPVKTGFSEYETKIGAIQTILSNTASKGTTMEDVTRVINELNTYADKTIYNFAEMTKNIGTFTAAGVGLEESATAIQGIANLAAASGSTSQQASTAMYQLSQALATGTVKLMDWNSVVNAGMGGEKFQNALKATAREMGVAVDDIIEKNGSFRDSLHEGWLTADILNTTLQKFTVEGAKDYAKSMKEAGTWTQKEADALVAYAQDMEDAATKVKTFTQLWDTLKESAQSGWAQTWELIVGDFDEAKEFLTGLSDTFGGIIGAAADARNKLLGGALNPWGEFTKKLNEAGVETEDFQDKLTKTAKEHGIAVDDLIDEYGSLKKVISAGKISTDIIVETLKKMAGIEGDAAKSTENMTEKLEYFQKVVNDVWRGDYKNGEERIKALTDAGYDYATVQDLVNKTVDGHKLTLEDLSDAQMKNLGYTEEQIKGIRKLAEQAEKSGTPINELIKDLQRPSGRELLIDSLHNALDGLITICKAVKQAWTEIFPPMTSDQLYNIIDGLHKFSEHLVVSEETSDNLKRTLKGVFAIIDIVLTIVGGPLKLAIQAIFKILGMANIDILEFTANIGDTIVKIRDWIDANNIFVKGFEVLLNPIKNAIKSIRNWIASLKDSKDLPKDIAQGIVNGFSKIPSFFKKIFSSIKSSIKNGLNGAPGDMISGFVSSIGKGLKVAGQVFVELGKMALNKLNEFLSAKGFQTISADAIAGFINGVKAKLGSVGQAMLQLGQTIINKIKEVLGIHSPSVVFASIGAFAMAGLILGLQNGLPAVWGFIKGLAAKAVELFKDIDLGTIIGGLAATGIVTGVLKIAKAFSALTAPLEGIGTVLEESAEPIAKVITNTSKVIKSFSKVLNGVAFSVKMEGIKKLAIALAILVGAIIVLTFFDVKELWNSVAIIAALAAILVALAFAVNKMSGASASIGKDGVNLEGFKAGMIGIAASLLLLAIAVKLVGSMDMNQAIQGFAGLALLIGAIVGVLAVYGALVKGKSAQNMDKAGVMFRKMATTMLLLAIVAKILAGMEWSEMGKAGAGLLGLVGIMALLMLISKIAGKNVEKVGKTIMKMATALLLLTIVAKIIAGMEWSEMGKAGVGLLGLVGVIALLVLITKLAGNSLDKLGTTILALAGAMAILVIVSKIIAGMEWREMGKAAVGLLGLVGIVAILVLITKLAKNDAPKIAATLLAMSAAIAILAVVAIILGLIDLKYLAKGIVAVGMLAALMALMIYATKDAKDCKGNIIAMSVAIAVMAAAVVILSLIDPSKLAGATIALSVVMAIFALLVHEAGKVNASVAVLSVMVIAIGVLAVALYMLASLPIDSLIVSAVSLSVLMLAMAAALRIVSNMNSGKALAGVLALTAIAVPLLAFVGVLAIMQHVDSALSNVLILTLLATAMTLLLIPLTLIGSVWVTALTGVLALTAMAIPLLAFVGILAIMQCISNAEANVKLLISLMTTLTLLTVVLALVGPLAIIGVSAMGPLMALILGIGALAVGVGALMDKFPQLEEFLNKGIPILEKMAYAVGSLAGNLIAGLVETVAQSLPTLGTALSDFMTNATPFITGIKMVDVSMLEGIGILAASILALTAVDLINGIATFMSGGSSLAELGTELSMFMLNALPFITGAKLIDPSMLTGVKTLAETVLILTAANVIEGLTSWFTGGSSLADFGAQLPALGAHLAAFAANLGTFDESKVTSVDCAARAIKAMAHAANEIPNEGGWLAKIVGDNSIATFGSYLPDLGTHISAFATNLGTFDESKVATIDCASKAIKSMATAASELPNEGGWLAKIVGDNSIATFGSYLPALGTNLAGFATNLGTFDDSKVTTVECAANAIKAIAKASESIPNEGGWLAAIVGDNTIATFGAYLPGLGTHLAGFATNLGEFTDAQVTTVTCAANAIKAMAEAASNIPNEGGWLAKIVGDNTIETFGGYLPGLGANLKGFASNLGTFTDAQVATVTCAVDAIAVIADLSNSDLKSASKNMGNFGEDLVGFSKDIKSFSDKMKDVGADNINSAAKSLTKLADGIASIATGNLEALKDFGESLKSVGKDGVKKFVDALTSSSAKTDVKKAGSDLIKKTVDGAESEADDMAKDFESIAEDAVDEMSSKSVKSSAFDAGADLVSGFANGISENSYQAAAKAAAMAAAAVAAAKAELDEHSPSRVGYKIGDFFGVAFVNAIGDYESKAYDASSDMAVSARKGLSNAISKIRNLIDSGMDSEPTIRPVLDLSDVESGASAIGRMFNFGSTIGVSANVGAISSMMNQRNQNGTNDDVVSAINKLRKELGNVGGTSYNINGITYDDGSNVADAVGELVHAMKVGRRT